MAVLVFLLSACFSSLTAVSPGADTQVESYFENTDHELTVYYIDGKESGNTMMIIGGIQGDEPGGYLAADLYADIGLEKGTLIVVPRANFYSIKRNTRGVFGDMNRKFSLNTVKNEDHDSAIIEILKYLMSQSDVLLNLHEGSGYFYPEYVTEIKNPMRYGQSIIIDDLHHCRPDGRIVDLEGPANRVIEKMNQSIQNTQHVFHLNNHNTFSENTFHSEQRGSATYNALSLFGIPAFGIETSKNIDSIETKVKYETLAINAFMHEYDIVPEHPRPYFPTPELDHLVVSVTNNPNTFAVKNGNTLTVPSGATIKVLSVVANYQRGLSVDIRDHGNTNDIGKVAIISSPTTIKIYKDAYQCGEVYVAVTSPEISSVQTPFPVRLEQVEIKINDKHYAVLAGDTLHIVRGDIIRIVHARTNDMSQSDLRVNFYGFVGNKHLSPINDAEDRGYDIDTAIDLLKGYDLNDKESLNRIEALKGKNAIGNVYIAIEEPEIQYLIVEHGDNTTYALTPGSIGACSKIDRIKILSFVSNISSNPFISVFVLKDNATLQELILPSVLDISLDTTIMFRRASLELGSISFKRDN